MSNEAKQIDDGGPAFPTQPCDQSGQPIIEASPGMSLRDHFAGQAMQGMIAYSPHHAPNGDYNQNSTYSQVAEVAYAHADAMIAARKGGAAPPQRTPAEAEAIAKLLALATATTDVYCMVLRLSQMDSGPSREAYAATIEVLKAAIATKTAEKNNARLIPATPDLLAALEESKIVFHLAIDLANSTSEIDTDQMKKRMEEIVVRCDAAIAKATGGAA